MWGSLGSLQERHTPRNLTCRLLVNSILLITKYYIYSCKFKKVVPSFSGVISLLRYKYKIEIFSASMLPLAKRQIVRDRWHEILLFMGED